MNFLVIKLKFLNMNSVNIKELKDIVNYIVDNNNKLREEGKKTTAIEIVGESGIGKLALLFRLLKKEEWM